MYEQFSSNQKLKVMLFAFIFIIIHVIKSTPKMFNMGCECGKRPNNSEAEKDCLDSALLEDHKENEMYKIHGMSSIL